MSVGWIVVSFFTFIVALGMAEIVSAIPTSGGPYFWAAMLAPPKHSAFASWITGWYVIPQDRNRQNKLTFQVQSPWPSRSYNRYHIWNGWSDLNRHNCQKC